MLWSELSAQLSPTPPEKIGDLNVPHQTSHHYFLHKYKRADHQTDHPSQSNNLVPRQEDILWWKKKVTQARCFVWCGERAGKRGVCGCLLCHERRDKSICMELKEVDRLKKEAQTCHGRRIS